MKNLLTSLLFTSLSILALQAQPGSGKALDLNGTSQYVNCGNINLSGSEITIQAWINVDQFKTNFPYISSVAGTEQTGHQACIRLGDATLASSKLQFILYNGSTHYKLDGIQNLQTNKWYHVAATYDGASMKIYINGVLDASNSTSISIVSNSSFQIGRNYGNDRILDGEVDEVSVFSEALSQNAIRDWMCKKITPTHPNYGSIEGYWPLNEGSGTSTTDASGNGNNGTLLASPAWTNSGAPIGDASKHAYGSTYSLGLSHAQGDSMHFSHNSGTLEAAHVYRVDSTPYVTSAPSPLNFLDTSHYWGIFVVGSSSYAVEHHYSGNTVIANNNDCNLDYARRNNGSASSWGNLSVANYDYANEVADWNQSGTREIIMAISNNGPHSLAFVDTEPSCNGGSDGMLEVFVSGGLGPYTYSWANGDVDSVSTNLSSGYHSVTITDANGCVSSDSGFVGELSLIGISQSITHASCALVADGEISVNATGGSGTGYSFLWNDPANTAASTVQNLLPGAYTVTVTDGNGCTNSFEISIGSTGIDPIVDLGEDLTLCDLESYSIAALVQNGPVASYLWSTGETNSTISVSQSGQYVLTATNDGGCIGVDTINIEFVEPAPFSLGSNVTAVGSHTVNAPSGFTNYVWSNGTNGSALTVTSSGTYSVTAKDSNGCTVSDEIKVTITPAGVSSVQENQVKIWPNPANNELNIATQRASDILLFDMAGRVVHSDKIVADRTNVIALTNLESGNYLLIIQNQSIQSQHRVIVMH